MWGWFPISTKRYAYKGTLRTAKYIAKDIGNITPQRVSYYLCRGYSVEQLAELPPVKNTAPAVPRHKKTNGLWAYPKTKKMLYQNQFKTIEYWANEYGLSINLVRTRLAKGWSMEDTLNKPKTCAQTFELDGVYHTRKEWAEIYGLTYTTVCDRIARGWDIRTALTRPMKNSKKEMNNNESQ